MYKASYFVAAIFCISSLVLSAHTTTRDTTESAYYPGPSLNELVLRPNAIYIIPTRLLNFEFPSLAIGYERAISEYFSADISLGLPLTNRNEYPDSKLAAGYEVGLGARLSMPTNGDKWTFYARIAGEYTANAVTFEGYINNPDLNYARASEATATRQRRELSIGPGVRFIDYSGLTLDLYTALGIQEIGLFDLDDNTIVRNRDFFNTSIGDELNTYYSMPVIRFRFGIGYRF